MNRSIKPNKLQWTVIEQGSEEGRLASVALELSCPYLHTMSEPMLVIATDHDFDGTAWRRPTSAEVWRLHSTREINPTERRNLDWLREKRRLTIDPVEDLYCVAVVIEDKAYGGPEEGGWYYWCCTPDDEYADLTRGFRRRAQARRYARELDKEIERLALNEGRPSISSVASRGWYTAQVFKGVPRELPDERPFYE